MSVNTIGFGNSDSNIQNEIQKNLIDFQTARYEFQSGPHESKHKRIEQLILTNQNYVSELHNYADCYLSKLDLIDHHQINNYWLKFVLPSIFPNLVFLEISGCINLTNDPTAFENLPKLKEIHLVDTKFKDFADIRPLLEKKIRVFLIGERASSVMKLAFDAAKDGDLNALDLVLKTGSFVAEDIFGIISDPSFFSIPHIFEWFERLTYHHRFSVNVKDHNENTVLHHLCHLGQCKHALVLLNHPDIERNPRNNAFQTPFDLLNDFFKSD